MCFEEKFKDIESGEITTDGCHLRSDRYGQCYMCKKPCEFIEINYEAYFCSEECEHEFESQIQFEEDDGWKS